MATFYMIAVLHDDILQGYLKVKNQVKEQMDGFLAGRIRIQEEVEKIRTAGEVV